MKFSLRKAPGLVAPGTEVPTAQPELDELVRRSVVLSRLDDMIASGRLRGQRSSGRHRFLCL